MKKLTVLGMGVCIALAFASCKSTDSAYKKAYEQAQTKELTTTTTETTPVVTQVTPVSTPVVTPTPEPVQASVQPEPGVRQEKVTVVSGEDGLKEYSVVCGSFTLKANAESLKSYLSTQGYSPVIAFNSEAATYRVIVSTYSDRASAASARDTFKNRYPNRQDFQGSWLLYRLY